MDPEILSVANTPARVASCVFSLALLLISGAAGADARVHLVRQDCGSCHGMRLTGGIGTPLTPEALAGKSVDSIVATILYGRPGTAMPAWKSVLSESDARWIAEQLLAGFPEDKK